jgi:2-polyprenyl-6-hydroxyphenyl methylase/3-demethylubiquinone-9 3-methyltransferase
VSVPANVSTEPDSRSATVQESMSPREYLNLYENSVYRRTKVHHISSLLGNDLRGKNVLDFGGGGGYMTLHCARLGARVTLIEDDPTQLTRAQSVLRAVSPESRCEFIRDRQVPQELLGRRFEIILAKDVLEHVPADGELVLQFAGCQVAGDRLLVSTQNRWSLNYLFEGQINRWWYRNGDWCGWDDSHVRFYTPVSLRHLAAREGYRPLAWRGTFIVPYNLPALLTLFRVKREWRWLRWIDLSAGRFFPFNRFGWNLIALMEKAPSVQLAGSKEILRT